jgi:ParB-like chromosome segregation protein Spo0J
MAIRKRRRAEPTAAAELAVKTTLDSKKSAQDIQTQLNERLATNVSKSGENVRLEKIALAKISPDPDNERTWYINQGTITILTQAFNEVWEAGAKSADLPETVLSKSLDQIRRYADNQNAEMPPIADVTETITGIWDFAVHLKTEPLLQPPAVSLGQGGKYHIVHGSRRFIASHIAHGDTHEIECLSYQAEPDFPAAKRFVENNQRSDLPLQAKVKDFKKAVAEIKQHAKTRVSNVEVANKLGVGRNLVQKLEKIAGSSGVNLLMATGQIKSVEFAYKMAVLEGADKPLFKAACNHIAEKGEPTGDFNSFKAALAAAQPKKPARKAAGRPSKIKFPAIGEPKVLQKLFAPQVLEQPQWQQLDWSDNSKPNMERIEKLIKETMTNLVKDMEAGA